MTEERAEPGGPEWAKLAGPHLARYLWAGELVAGRRVLDVACGSGYGAVLLRHAGARHVLGVDRDPAAIERADRASVRSRDLWGGASSGRASPIPGVEPPVPIRSAITER